MPSVWRVYSARKKAAYAAREAKNLALDLRHGIPNYKNLFKKAWWKHVLREHAQLIDTRRARFEIDTTKGLQELGFTPAAAKAFAHAITYETRAPDVLTPAQRALLKAFRTNHFFTYPGTDAVRKAKRERNARARMLLRARQEVLQDKQGSPISLKSSK